MQVVEVEKGVVPLKLWTDGVELEEAAFQQLRNVAALPIVHPHVAVLPDVHWGMGATVGSVIPTKGAIIPAAVGVDIGCGMVAVRLDRGRVSEVRRPLRAEDLPDTLADVRDAIERAVPHGRTNDGRAYDKGAWHDLPDASGQVWREELSAGHAAILDKYPKLKRANSAVHLGTLGTGNHFIEVCLDEVGDVWVMLHSGSRGIGNAIGSHFIQVAREEMKGREIVLRDANLAYLEEGSPHFADYVEAVGWAQRFAWHNRQLMLDATIHAIGKALGLTLWPADAAVNCHHNYVASEEHFGSRVWLTRKGAVSARLGELGIIPGSMGVCSYIVRGKGNPESFMSCSHGAGRRMSRGEAKRTFTLKDHREATEGVECRKDKDVLDETPGAYKDIEAVMAAQADLVEVVHTLKQCVCVKG